MKFKLLSKIIRKIKLERPMYQISDVNIFINFIETVRTITNTFCFKNIYIILNCKTYIDKLKPFLRKLLKPKGEKKETSYVVREYNFRCIPLTNNVRSYIFPMHAINSNQH